MKLGNLLIFHAIVALAFGTAFVLTPMSLLSFYGVTLGPGGRLLAQLLGAAHIGIGLLNWVVRNTTESEVLRAIIPAYFIAIAIGFIVALLGQLSGVMNALGWSAVAIYLLLALGYGYFQFAKTIAA